MPQYEDPEYRYGQKVHVSTSTKEASNIIIELLSKYKGDKTLTVFAINAELNWVSRACPSLALHLSAWADLQELVL